jgi:hypothetical protein
MANTDIPIDLYCHFSSSSSQWKASITACTISWFRFGMFLRKCRYMTFMSISTAMGFMLKILHSHDLRAALHPDHQQMVCSSRTLEQPDVVDIVDVPFVRSGFGLPADYLEQAEVLHISASLQNVKPFMQALDIEHLLCDLCPQRSDLLRVRKY